VKPGTLRGSLRDRAETDMTNDDSFRRSLDAFSKKLMARVRDRQNGIPTFFDHFYYRTLKQLRQLDPSVPLVESVGKVAGAGGGELMQAFELLRGVVHRDQAGRYIDFDVRKQEEAGGTPVHDVNTAALVVSQGVHECMQWKGMPLFKTVYEFSLYPMLIWNLKPGTIIELGSGTGSSAIWMRDLLHVFGLECHVYSIDLHVPELACPGVSFIQGDIMEIGEILDAAVLESMRRPVLVIEDAHVNVVGALRFFDGHLLPGDYVVVEDSLRKQAEIGEFLDTTSGVYKLDTYYADFFGRNVCSAPNSIFVRQQDLRP
jgi:cephalosporin hydroxylase